MSDQFEQTGIDTTLREVVETLAPIDRTPCSAGERQAADWLATRMRAIDGVDVAVEDEPSWGIFPPTSVALGAIGIAGGALVMAKTNRLKGRRLKGGLMAAVTLAGIVDEAQNGPRIVRRILRRRRKTVNVIATVGPRHAEPTHDDRARSNTSKTPTLVVLAHHDAPQTGVLFDQTLQQRLYKLAPSQIGRAKTPPPQWWIGLAGPAFTIAGAILGSRKLARAGIAVGLFGTAIVADVWRHATVPGANDNLSGVAALVALAELFTQRPPENMRVMLVSCGAEETLQDGIRAFMARHRHELDTGSTWFVNLDTVGSPHLVMLEAEGPVWMENYPGPELRDLLAASAQRLGVGFERGFRARSSTDSVIPSRAGYPIATLVSITDWRSPANYHLPSDIPANLDYGTVADATRVVYDVGCRLAVGHTDAAVADAVG